MAEFLRKIQLIGALIILTATVTAFIFEIIKMFSVGIIQLSDLLLLFIYLEVIGMITSYWRTLTIRLTYPLFISITAISRLIILQKKDIDPATLIFESCAILILALAIIILKLRKSKYLGTKLVKDDM